MLFNSRFVTSTKKVSNYPLGHDDPNGTEQPLRHVIKKS